MGIVIADDKQTTRTQDTATLAREGTVLGIVKDIHERERKDRVIRASRNRPKIFGHPNLRRRELGRVE
jgi:hypothetical protein